jgi:hypothetical protein
MNIRFTQFMMPDGHTREEFIDRPEPIARKAKILQEKDYDFEIEMLQTGEINMDIIHRETQEVVAGELCPNGPQVPVCVDKMVEQAWTHYENSAAS